MLSAILNQFGFIEHTYTVAPFGSGLINNTWLAQRAGKKYIVQRINQNVFKTPEAIDENISSIAAYLKLHHPEYLFTVPLSSGDEKTLVLNNDGAYRIFEFIEDSQTYNTLQKPAQAYEAAKQFGIFTKLLGGFDASSLKITLPHFHDLSLRYEQFLEAVEQGNSERILFAGELISSIKNIPVL